MNTACPPPTAIGPEELSGSHMPLDPSLALGKKARRGLSGSPHPGVPEWDSGSASSPVLWNPRVSSFPHQAGPAQSLSLPLGSPPTPSSCSCLFSQISCAQSFLKAGCPGGFVCQLRAITPTSSTDLAFGYGLGGNPPIPAASDLYFKEISGPHRDLITLRTLTHCDPI